MELKELINLLKLLDPESISPVGIRPELLSYEQHSDQVKFYLTFEKVKAGELVKELEQCVLNRIIGHFVCCEHITKYADCVLLKPNSDKDFIELTAEILKLENAKFSKTAKTAKQQDLPNMKAICSVKKSMKLYF